MQIPENRRDLTGWLYGRYLEKDAMLGEYYAGDGEWTGDVPLLAPSLVSAFKAADIPVAEMTASRGQLERGETQLNNSGPRKVHHDLVRILLVHLFFIFSTILHALTFARLLT